MEVGDEVSPDADFDVRVSGDSMEPLYLNGQIIWVHQQETLEDGEIGIFFLDGEAYVKKYHQTPDGISLISMNKKYAPIKVSSGSVFRTFGKSSWINILIKFFIPAYNRSRKIPTFPIISNGGAYNDNNYIY